jgi:hypothetical protein
MPDLASDSRIWVGTLGFCLSTIKSRFLTFQYVRGYKFVGIAFPRDTSCSHMIRWRKGGVDLVGVGLGLFYPRVMDSPPVAANRVFVVFFTCSYEFVVRSVELVVFLCKEFGGRSASKAQTVRGHRTVRSESSTAPFFPVHYWRFGLHFRTVRALPSDGPPGPCGQFATFLWMIHPVLHRLPKFFAP